MGRFPGVGDVVAIHGNYDVIHPAGGDADVTIERVPYDAEAVAGEVRRSGLPARFADQLLLAA